MSLSKQARLVLSLLTKTKAGKVDWQSAARNKAFQVSFPNYSVLIYLAKGEIEDDIVLDIINEEGQLTDTFRDTDLIPEQPDNGPEIKWYQTMLELYNAARRWSLGADKALDTILAELDADDHNKEDDF